MTDSSSPKSISLLPIGHVRSTGRQVEDDGWAAVGASIELDASRFSADDRIGLVEFSRAEIIFHLDQVDPAKIETSARHPRGDTA